jgi:hypothetical protein
MNHNIKFIVKKIKNNRKGLIATAPLNKGSIFYQNEKNDIIK